VAVLFGLWLAGCMSASADKLNNIHIGMTRNEVVALLGSPDSTSAQGNIEYLTYYLTNDANQRDQPYAVRLVNAKVESFGRFTQLADIYNRPVNGSAPNPWGMPTVIGPVAAPVATTPDLVVQLQQLKTLKDQGALTDDEFQKAKTRILSHSQ
jgi:hypothetical protein